MNPLKRCNIEIAASGRRLDSCCGSFGRKSALRPRAKTTGKAQAKGREAASGYAALKGAPAIRHRLASEALHNVRHLRRRSNLQGPGDASPSAITIFHRQQKRFRGKTFCVDFSDAEATRESIRADAASFVQCWGLDGLLNSQIRRFRRVPFRWRWKSIELGFDQRKYPGWLATQPHCV